MRDSGEEFRGQKALFNTFVSSLPSREGEEVVVCPACGKTVKVNKVKINAMNKYAFHDGICVTMNGRGCCWR